MFTSPPTHLLYITIQSDAQIIASQTDLSILWSGKLKRLACRGTVAPDFRVDRRPIWLGCTSTFAVPPAPWQPNYTAHNTDLPHHKNIRTFARKSSRSNGSQLSPSSHHCCRGNKFGNPALGRLGAYTKNFPRPMIRTCATDDE